MNAVTGVHLYLSKLCFGHNRDVSYSESVVNTSELDSEYPYTNPINIRKLERRNYQSSEEEEEEKEEPKETTVVEIMKEPTFQELQSNQQIMLQFEYMHQIQTLKAQIADYQGQGDHSAEQQPLINQQQNLLIDSLNDQINLKNQEIENIMAK